VVLLSITINRMLVWQTGDEAKADRNQARGMRQKVSTTLNSQSGTSPQLSPYTIVRSQQPTGRKFLFFPLLPVPPRSISSVISGTEGRRWRCADLKLDARHNLDWLLTSHQAPGAQDCGAASYRTLTDST
jgi:hypothetical protein